MRSSGRSQGGNLKIRIIIGVVLAIVSLISYIGSQEFNPVTGEKQYISLTQDQEIALGWQSVPSLIEEFGGMHPDDEVQQAIDDIGWQLVNNSVARDGLWEFEFFVLNDPNTINAFALPGGPVFITTGLLNQLKTEDEVAGVLSHEIVHVLARHGAQRIAQNELTNGLVGAVGVASGSANSAQTAAMIAQLVNMQYGRGDELESDMIGVCLMLEAGYDPEGMVGVMEVLGQAMSGNRQPEFFSTHPNPENRIEKIKEAIANAAANCPE